ncbi:ABC transporter permease subunit [Xylophilus rhododendri]|uniref:ABC transporter permease subunit n=1 Tax=Xylophilus rhododendri TaxID=2697032 RepID=A0A857J650_9BURK|nr:amino acid ABC transporter permease [Xylophilus rhododendri]QHI99460.1 ABC transporter permease subunit [Xylophilus rhododendri]
MSFSLVLSYLLSPAFFHGALITLLITICSLVFGAAVGLLVALLQESRSRAAHGITMGYLWLFRGTPVLFQIIFVYNVLPSFGIKLSAVVSAVLALSLNEGAYMAEIIRSGLQAIKKGQRTAALALGMFPSGVMRHVVIPQAVRIILPPMGNQMIGMLKLSALVSVVAVEDLLLVANQTASSNFKYFEALTAAGIYYLALTTLFMALQSLIERRLDPKSRRKRAAQPLAQRLLGSQRPGTVR